MGDFLFLGLKNREKRDIMKESNKLNIQNEVALPMGEVYLFCRT